MGGDEKRIKDGLGIAVQGVEIIDKMFGRRGRLTKEVAQNHAPRIYGLRAVSEYYGMAVKKDKAVSRSNWATRNLLSIDQIRYAADDAWFSFQCARFVIDDLEWLQSRSRRA